MNKEEITEKLEKIKDYLWNATFFDLDNQREVFFGNYKSMDIIKMIDEIILKIGGE
jgi:hypothetical protein